MKDLFKNSYPSLESPGHNCSPITASDSQNLRYATRALYVGVAGDVACIFIGDSDSGDVIIKNLAVGLWPLRLKKVLDTGTTATSLLGVY